MSALCQKRTFATRAKYAFARANDALPDHQSFAVRSHHHGSFGSGQAQSRLWCSNCLATSYFNSRHDLAMARHGRQSADSCSFGRNVLACVANTAPMFLVLPAMLRNGFAFWTALAISCALTVALYLVAVWLLPKLGSTSEVSNLASVRL